MPVQPTGIPRPTTLPFIHVYDHLFTTSTLFDPKLEHSVTLFLKPHLRENYVYTN